LPGRLTCRRRKEVKTGVNRLTEGPLVRGLFSLALPMLASAAMQNAQTLIDLFWVGRLGSSAVAALAISASVLMTLFPLVLGATTGTVAMISRRFGAGELDEAACVGAQSLGLGLVLGVATGLCGVWFAEPICRLLGAGPDVLPLATDYLRICFAGGFAVFLLFIANSVLQAAGNTVAPMLIMLAGNIVNVVLDPILIFGLLGAPAMGVRGAAVATVIAQFCAGGLAVGLLFSGRVRVHIRARHARFRPDLLAGIARIGLPGSAQMLARSMMTLVLMRIVAGCGTAAVAAYGIGLRFQALILMPAFALGNSAATMVGQNLGAGRPDRAARAAWTATAADGLIMAAGAALLSGFAPFLIGVFDPTAEVVAVGVSFLRITSWFYVFVAFAIVLGRALQGAGDTLSQMAFTFIALWGVQVPLAVFLSARMDPPTDGIWWAVAAAVTLHGLLVTAWFQTGRWKRKKV